MCNCWKEKETNIVKSIMLFQTYGWPDWVASDVLKRQMNMMKGKARNPPLWRKNIIGSGDSVERKRKEKYQKERRNYIILHVGSHDLFIILGCGTPIDFLSLTPLKKKKKKKHHFGSKNWPFGRFGEVHRRGWAWPSPQNEWISDKRKY